jgi:hypothetical protein
MMEIFTNPIYLVSMMIPKRRGGMMEVLPLEAEVHEE